MHSGEVDTDSVADQISPMVRDLDADIVVLPEVGWVTGERVGDLLSSSGFPNKTFAPESATTSVILSTALSDSGGYTIDSDAPPWAGVVLRPETVSADTPVIVGVHLQQPGITSADTWQMHLQWIRDLYATSLVACSFIVRIRRRRGCDCTTRRGRHLGGVRIVLPDPTAADLRVAARDPPLRALRGAKPRPGHRRRLPTSDGSCARVHLMSSQAVPPVHPPM